MEFREGNVIQLAEGIFLRQAVDNCLWADMGDGTLVVDAQEETKMAPIIEREIAKTVGKPIRWVVNTHWHGDHIACNPLWASKGATIIAHQSCAPATTARDGNPDITFQDRYVLQGGERCVELEWLGGMHTDGDIIVYFPWAQVLHAGDLFGWGLFMQHHWDAASIERTRAVLLRLLEFETQHIVCAHGPMPAAEHIKRQLDYYNTTLNHIAELKAAGKSLAEVKAALPPPQDMLDWWRFLDWKHDHNIEAAYRAL